MRPGGKGSKRNARHLGFSPQVLVQASRRTALAEEDTAGPISSSGLSPLQAGDSGKRELGFHNSCS